MKPANLTIEKDDSKEISYITLNSMSPFDCYMIEKDNKKVASVVYLAVTENNELITIYKPYNLEKLEDEELVTMCNMYHFDVYDQINIRSIINNTPTYISSMEFEITKEETLFDAYNVADSSTLTRFRIDSSIVSGIKFINDNLFKEDYIEDENGNTDFDFAAVQCNRNNETELFIVKDIKNVIDVYLNDPPTLLLGGNDKVYEEDGTCAVVLVDEDGEDLLVRFQLTMNLTKAQITKIKNLSKDEKKEHDNLYYSFLFYENDSINVNGVYYENAATTLCRHSNYATIKKKKYVVLDSAMKDLLKKKIYEY